MILRAAEAGLDDAILVNTCAVTAEAVRQARQAIRKARREHPEQKIVVSGCAAQTEPEKFAAMPEVDLVLGNEEKLHAESYRRIAATLRASSSGGHNTDVVIAGPDPAIHSVPAEHAIDRSGMDARIKSGHDDGGRDALSLPHAEVLHPAPSRLFHPPHGEVRPRTRSGGASNHGGEKAPRDEGLQTRLPLPDFGLSSSEKIRVGDIFAVRETAAHLIDGFAPDRPHTLEERRARAFVQVQNGCDHRCTFCVIPYGRGNSRSVPMGAVVDAVRRLVERGVAEIVLTGVDVTAYGADLPGQPKLGALVRKILKHVPELPRLRLTSIDSVEADDELMRAIAEEERLMPHLHLSLQSGDDMILKRMKRRHSRADAIRFCEEVRRLRPDIVFGADLIAGFPTETEEMFQNTLALVADCGLTLLHVFPFSARPGTPAARMPQTAPDVVRSRAQTGRQQGHSALSARLSAEVGKVRNILVEKPGFGRTEHYLPVEFEGGAAGEIMSARIEAASDKLLFAHEIRAAA